MKKSILQNLFFIITIFSVIISTVSCGDSTNSNNDASKNPNLSKYNLGEYAVEIVSCSEPFRDAAYSRYYVIVTYVFENHSQEANSFSYVVRDEIYQNGMEVSEFADYFNITNGNASKKIQPGASITVEVLYKLNDIESPIDVEISSYEDDNIPKIKKTFEIK